MGMSRLISQLFLGFFSHGNTIRRPQPWAHSQAAPSRLKRLSLHTQAVTPTQPVTEHTNILTGLSQFCVGHFPSSCPCYKLSITPSLSHRTAFAYYCLLLIVIYISAETELHHFLFFKRVLCTCKFWMLACVIWMWLLFKIFPKWGTCDP